MGLVALGKPLRFARLTSTLAPGVGAPAVLIGGGTWRWTSLPFWSREWRNEAQAIVLFPGQPRLDSSCSNKNKTIKKALVFRMSVVLIRWLIISIYINNTLSSHFRHKGYVYITCTYNTWYACIYLIFIYWYINNYLLLFWRLTFIH